MQPQPQLSPDALVETLRSKFEEVLRSVADAVNQAPPGQVINASAAKVGQLFADFRPLAYPTAVQLRRDAAEAAFPPSAAPPDRYVFPKPGTPAVQRPDQQ